MPYKAELEYLLKVAEKMNLRTLRLKPGERSGRCPDFGIRGLLGLDTDCRRVLRPLLRQIKENTICKLTDQFSCCYIILTLPEAEVLLLGPYLTAEKTREQLMEEAERYGVPAGQFRQLEACYGGIPVVREEKPLFAMLNVFGETLWGKGRAFSIMEIDHQAQASDRVVRKDAAGEAEETLLRMKTMESRYAYENQLMENISQGLTHRAELMLSGISKLALELRTKDPVRNIKNYCIVSNTLMRKAAERGGVHPMHLDSVSSAFAGKVEAVTGVEEGAAMMREMVRTYCRLVRQHAGHHYSPLVQKVMDCVDSDLTGDLGLKALAALQNVNASYLSTLFHRETGKTITEYVTEIRMNNAARLIQTTHLQIQTVAQHCGIADVNYFSKVFKRHFGVTPKQFREDHQLPGLKQN